MNDPRNDKFWREMKDELRDALDLRPLTDEEAERAYDEAEPVPFTEDQIAEFIKIASDTVPREPSYEERSGGTVTDSTIDQEVGEVLGMHRNEGDVDPDVEEEMRRQREEALQDDDEEEPDDDEKTEES